jgi:integrase
MGLKSLPQYADVPSIPLEKWLYRQDSERMVTLAEAIRLCVEAKKFANRRPRYVESLRQYLTLFARGRETINIRRVNIRIIEDWFATRNESPTTRASNVGRLSALLSFSYRRGWIRENPCFRLERISIEQRPPRILSVDECRTLLTFCFHKKPVALAFLALCLFGGLRPEECKNISWSDVRDGHVHVSAAASKVRRRRIVRLEPVAVRWLKKAHELNSTLPVSRITHRRYIRAFRDALKLVQWPQDCLRHTCASYWLSYREDVAFVSYMLGNSPAILLRHYRELVPKSEAERFFALDGG